MGLTSIEELSDISDVLGNESGNGKGRAGKPAARMKPVEKPSSDQQKKTPPVETKGVSAEQKTQPNTTKEPEKATAGEPTGPPKGDSKGNGKPTGEPKLSSAQQNAIYNLSRRRGISVDELQKMALEKFGSELTYLSTKDASSFIRSLQNN